MYLLELRYCFLEFHLPPYFVIAFVNFNYYLKFIVLINLFAFESTIIGHQPRITPHRPSTCLFQPETYLLLRSSLLPATHSTRKYQGAKIYLRKRSIYRFH